MQRKGGFTLLLNKDYCWGSYSGSEAETSVLLLGVSVACQRSDSIFKSNIWTFLPGAILLLCSNHDCAKTAVWPLISYTKTKSLPFQPLEGVNFVCQGPLCVGGGVYNDNTRKGCRPMQINSGISQKKNV